MLMSSLLSTGWKISWCRIWSLGEVSSSVDRWNTSKWFLDHIVTMSIRDPRWPCTEVKSNFMCMSCVTYSFMSHTSKPAFLCLECSAWLMDSRQWKYPHEYSFIDWFKMLSTAFKNQFVPTINKTHVLRFLMIVISKYFPLQLSGRPPLEDILAARKKNQVNLCAWYELSFCLSPTTRYIHQL